MLLHNTSLSRLLSVILQKTRGQGLTFEVGERTMYNNALHRDLSSDVYFHCNSKDFSPNGIFSVFILMKLFSPAPLLQTYSTTKPSIARSEAVSLTCSTGNTALSP